jgi:hypothetical protein
MNLQKEFEEQPFYIIAYEINKKTGKEEGFLKHLELSDDVWLWIEQKLKEACKEQRENVMEAIKPFMELDEDMNYKDRKIYEAGINAPEPSGKE